MKNKLKVLQINKYPSLKGGSEVVLFDTIDLLGEGGHEVILFATDEGEAEYTPSYTINYSAKNASFANKAKYLRSFFYNKEAAKKLEQIIEKEKPDIAHIHLYLNGLSQSILPVLRKHGIPVVMTLHDYRQICPSYLLLDKNRNICEKCINGNYFNCMFTRCSKGRFVESTLLSMEMYYRRIFYKTEKYIDRFICVSEFQYQKYKQFNHRIADKAVVLYNPVDLPVEKKIARGEYLLFSGRLSTEKGLNTLLEAMRKFPDVDLKIAGKGDMRFSDIPSNVEFVGFKNKPDLKVLIENAKFVVVPSEWYETFGLSCAESLSLGTPVIASDIGALPEMVRHKENGFLFRPKDIDNLVETLEKGFALSDEEYMQMSRVGQESTKKFSRQNYIAQLLDLYNSIHKTGL